MSSGYAPPAKLGTNKAADECADDAENYSDYAAGRVTSWYQIFREGPGYETQKNPVEPERHRPTVSLYAEPCYGTRGPRVRVAIL